MLRAKQLVSHKPTKTASPGGVGLSPEAIGAQSTHGILAFLGIVLAYRFSFARAFRRYQGDRFIEFALVTMFLFLVMMELDRVHG